jgi:nitrate reductase alpha subunit
MRRKPGVAGICHPSTRPTHPRHIVAFAVSWLQPPQYFTTTTNFTSHATKYHFTNAKAKQINVTNHIITLKNTLNNVSIYY